MMQQKRIAILLAAYNGELYLKEQMDSLFAQQNQDWDLIVSDDCSVDSTYDILRWYKDKYKEKVILLNNDMPSGSSKNNFFRLLENAEGYDYIMFCDQDDVWNQDKVGDTLQSMRQLENEEPQVPCLVHTDMKVVDSSLNLLQQSFVKSSLLDPKRCELKQLVIQNVVSGCTTMINAALREKALLPADRASIRMHDWWCALWAAAIGRIDFLPIQTSCYRQHGKNVVGAKDVNSLSYLIHYLKRFSQNKQALLDTERQAGAFYEAAKDYLSEEQKILLYDFSTLNQKGKIKRVKTVAKYGIWLTGWRRQVGEVVQI